MFVRRSVNSLFIETCYLLNLDDVATKYDTLCQISNLTQTECSRRVRSKFAQGNLPCLCEQRCNDDYWAVQVSIAFGNIENDFHSIRHSNGPQQLLNHICMV